MDAKICFKCNELKPLSDFYQHSQMADGHLNKCKGCAKKDAFNHRHGDGRDRVLSYDQERAKTPERIDAARIIFNRWREQNPERNKAGIKLRNAVRDGKVLKWPVCSLPECEGKPVAHHPDYSQPLDVVWLCQAHHKQAHAILHYLKEPTCQK